MSKKSKNKREAQQPQGKQIVPMSSTINCTNTNQEHNTKKESLGPNTKR